MLEALNNKTRLNIISVITSVLLSLGLYAKNADAFNTKEVPFNSGPFEASTVLKKTTGPGGDKYESFIFSIKFKNQWYSVGAKGASQGIPNDIANRAISELERKLKLDNLMDEFDNIQYMVTIHNHSAEVLYSHMNFFGLEKHQIKDKSKILSGPSNGTGDCPQSFVSIIVEPGGSWLCKEINQTLNTLENGPKLITLRKELILASQNLEGEDLLRAIDKFITQTRLQVGLEIRFIPNGTSKLEFERMVGQFSKINP